MTTQYPFKVSVTINVDDLPNGNVRKAITAMAEAGLDVDGLIQAVLSGMSPRYYAESRMEFGHTHDEIMANKTLINNQYLNLRRKQGCSAREALAVMELDDPQYGRSGRDIYRACRKAGWGHRESLKAMKMAKAAYDLGQRIPFAYRNRSGKPYVPLTVFVEQAAKRESNPNEIWRSYLAYYNHEPYDLT